MILRSRNVVTPHGIRDAAIHVEDGRISAISDFDDVPAGASVEDFGDLFLMPGVVDSHVHVNEPGRTEWEGFETATRAAAAGGVTTIVDMPLNSIPPTTSVEALMTKAEALEGKCHVDVGLWGGAVPGNAGELAQIVKAGALGFKCFLVDSGVPEFGHLSAEELGAAMIALRDTGVPLLVHAELGEHLHPFEGNPKSYRGYLESRPSTAEDAAIELVAATSARTGARAHIVHLSSAGALDVIRRARDKRIPLTAETTPHYLFFDAERIPDGAPEYKCAPPIREHDNRESLWNALREDLFTAVVSDHSPCVPELKRMADGNVAAAWGGIASLQFALPIVWTEAQRRGFRLETVSRLMSSGPASLAGLGGRKGRLAVGYDADVIVFAPDESFEVTPQTVQHRHRVTPYTGHRLLGVVKHTYLRGVRAEGTARGIWLSRRGLN